MTVSVRALGEAIGQILPGASFTGVAGIPGHWLIMVPEAVYDQVGGAHVITARLGDQIGTRFGTDGVAWDRGTATVQVYERETPPS
jgi:hypothetical protein